MVHYFLDRRYVGNYLMLRTSGAASYPVHVLVGLAGMLGEVDARPEHAPNVGVALVKSLLGDSLNKGGFMG